MNLKKFYLSILILIFCFGLSKAGGERDLELGISYYNERYSSAPDYSCNPEKVDLSIECFERALKNEETREKAGEHLLWAYFYKAMFICKDEQAKKENFSRGRDLGEELVKEFPQNINLKYGYTTNIGKLSEINGVFSSACQGVAGKIKENVEKAMEIDPDYEMGLGYRLKAILYFKAPYIPVILPWASKDEAFEMAEHAVKKWPSSVGNMLTLGELYYWNGDMDKARDIFRSMQSMAPREDHRTLDNYEIGKASRYIREIDKDLAQSRANR